MLKIPGSFIFILLLYGLTVPAQNEINIGNLTGKWSYAWQEIYYTNPPQVSDHETIYTFYPDHTAESIDFYRNTEPLRMSWNYNPEKKLLVFVTKNGGENYVGNNTILKLTSQTMLLKTNNADGSNDTLEFKRIENIHIGNLPGKWKLLPPLNDPYDFERDVDWQYTFYRDHTGEYTCTGARTDTSGTLWNYNPDANVLVITIPKFGDMEKDRIDSYAILTLSATGLVLQRISSQGYGNSGIEKFERVKN